MKKTLLFVLLGALAVTPMLQAQNRGQGGPGGGQATQGRPSGPGGPGGGRMMMMRANEQILAKLNLTAAQKTKIKALDASTMKKMQALRGKQLDRDKMRTEFRAIQTSHRESLMKILTPPQRKKYDELMTAERAKWRQQFGRPGGPGGAGGPRGGGGRGG